MRERGVGPAGDLGGGGDGNGGLKIFSDIKQSSPSNPLQKHFLIMAMNLLIVTISRVDDKNPIIWISRNEVSPSLLTSSWSA